MVDPEHQGEGIGRALLERCWPGDPTPDLGRLVVATGAPADLTLYPDFGVMPVTGHWHMRARTERYLERRAHADRRARAGRARAGARARGGGVEAPRAARDRPRAPGAARVLRARPHLPRDRRPRAADATGLCWVSSQGEIGPAVGGEPEDLVPVVLAALDRVAKTQEPDELSLFCTTIAWWLLRRLRGLGFRVYWPSWVMCSVPLPGPRPVRADAARPIYSEGMVESLKELGNEGARAPRPAARGVPALQDRARASRPRWSGSVLAVAVLLAALWALSQLL